MKAEAGNFVRNLSKLLAGDSDTNRARNASMVIYHTPAGSYARSYWPGVLKNAAAAALWASFVAILAFTRADFGLKIGNIGI